MSWRRQYDETQNAEIWYQSYEALKYFYNPLKQMYENPARFSTPDLSLVKIRLGEKWGFATSDGRVIVPPQWDQIGPLPGEGGYFLAVQYAEWEPSTALLNRDGQVLLAPCCYTVLRVEADRALVMRKAPEGAECSMECVWLNWQGQMAGRPEWTIAPSGMHSFMDGIMRIWQDGKVNCIDLAGRLVFDRWWDDMGEFGGTDEFHSDKHPSPLTWARLGDRFGFISRLTGKTVIPPVFEEAMDFGRGYDDMGIFDDNDCAAVKWNGKWGFIDDTGALVADCRWDSVEPFCNRCAKVRLGGAAYSLNRQGMATELSSTPDLHRAPPFLFEGDKLWAQAIFEACQQARPRIFQSFWMPSPFPRVVLFYLVGRIPLLDLLEEIPEMAFQDWEEPERWFYRTVAPECLRYRNKMQDCTHEEKLTLDRFLVHAADKYLTMAEKLEQR